MRVYLSAARIAHWDYKYFIGWCRQKILIIGDNYYGLVADNCVVYMHRNLNICYVFSAEIDALCRYVDSHNIFLVYPLYRDPIYYL